MRNFKKLEIWQYGFQIATNCFKITATFPKSENWGLVSQINKAAVSIPSNIAEGSGRSGERDYKRFIEISLGSSFELETQLLISKTLSLGKKDLIDETLILLDREEKMLLSFIRSLKI
jgi:four helix bundle protein